MEKRRTHVPYTYLCAYNHTHTNVCTQIYIHKITYIYAYDHTYTHICVRVYIYIRIIYTITTTLSKLSSSSGKRDQRVMTCAAVIPGMVVSNECSSAFCQSVFRRICICTYLYVYRIYIYTHIYIYEW